MERKPVDSSQIASVGYDPLTLTLEIEFRTGGVYRYADVPEVVALALQGAESVGTYFGKHVRDVYPTTRLDRATGKFVALAEAKASPRSVSFLRRLAAERGIATEDAQERTHAGWLPIAQAAGVVVPPDVLVDEWLGGLAQSQASKAIGFLKDAR
jgi:hypothetical protein